ncbi:hypothetical protein AB4Y44_03495 [Paraburkholderia sp. BR10937]|uniref:hypothetical protein n=1 Tax=Paraburkholderia sp. BR10937 TaxID=3236994 RepID=UPI0034D1D213
MQIMSPNRWLFLGMLLLVVSLSLLLVVLFGGSLWPRSTPVSGRAEKQAATISPGAINSANSNATGVQPVAVRLHQSADYRMY